MSFRQGNTIIARPGILKPVKTETAESAATSSCGIRDTRRLLVLCTTATVTPARKKEISGALSGPIDWEYFIGLAGSHGVAPLVSHNLITHGLDGKIPRPYLERMKQIVHGTLYSNVILSNELTRLLAAFGKNNVPAIVLKGTTLAEELYGNLALRTASDMDILVPPENIDTAGSLLQQLGYQQRVSPQDWDHPFHEAPFVRQARRPLMVELHRNLDNENLVVIPRQRIWGRAVTVRIQGAPVTVLSPEDNLLFLADHLSKHSTRLLMLLSDIAELLKKYRETLDWDYVIRSAREWNVAPAAHFALQRAWELLGAPVPAYVFADLKVAAWRRGLFALLMDRRYLVSGMNLTKLRMETATAVRSLMMKTLSQMLLVHSRNRRGKKMAWLGAVVWLIAVLGAALGRRAVGVVDRSGY
ncbi:MAG: hypothetical protein A2Z29_08420 [Chloroflexi bacterium RBG_16_56_11]|nr:MAG: hypothetical protein A2Z29_08420 [Chloroflexi bacterium RBG_16_56_11]